MFVMRLTVSRWLGLNRVEAIAACASGEIVGDLTVLITGGSGFLGSSIARQLADKFSVVVHCRRPSDLQGSDLRQVVGDICDIVSMERLCKEIMPDAIVHCAGIAHQGIGRVSRSDYFKVNTNAAVSLAEVAAKINPNVNFVFLSTVNVYGEFEGKVPKITRRFEPRSNFLNEEDYCMPSGPYAESKLAAEQALVKLYDSAVLKRLAILRLAPVYDSGWTFNLDRRVMAPLGLSYIRFGSGRQNVSVLARPNLSEFVEFLVTKASLSSESYMCTLNVSDARAYSFNRVIRALKHSRGVPLMVVTVPLALVKVMTVALSCIDRNRASWWLACYHKLAGDVTYSNLKMLRTGFVPNHTLESILGGS